MSQSYSRTYPEFWTSQVAQLDDTCRMLAHYLYSGPNVPPWGLYHRPVRALVLELSRPEKVLRAALGNLAEIGYVQVDEPTGFIWVVEQAAYQLRPLPLRGNNMMVRSARRWYAVLAKNPFLGPFYDRYAEDLLLSDPTVYPGTEVARRDYALLVAEQPSLLGEPSPEPRAPSPKKTPAASGFEQWIAAYPTHRQAPTKRALEAWRRRKLTAVHVPAMLATLETQKRSNDWTKNQGQYVPKACNYLRDELDREVVHAKPAAPWHCPHSPRCRERQTCDDRYYREEIARER